MGAAGEDAGAVVFDVVFHEAFGEDFGSVEKQLPYDGVVTSPARIVKAG